MIWNEHYDLEGQHAFLSPSKPSWHNYDKKKLIAVFESDKAKDRGTRLHAIAAEMISVGIRAEESQKTFCMYVNDAIAYKMRPEQVLYYSKHCYGTADAISFDDENQFLRIHDLKTGVSPVHWEQLLTYAALFCLEYGYNPKDISCELRFYQNDDIQILNPTYEQLNEKVNTIVRDCRELDKYEKKMGV